MKNSSEREVAVILDFMKAKSDKILSGNGFDNNGTPLQPDQYDFSPILLDKNAILRAAVKMNLGKTKTESALTNAVSYEDIQHTVNISIDNVIVKKQKEHRNAVQETREDDVRKSIANTIVHLEFPNKCYTINSSTYDSSLSMTIAFLFNNNLVGKRLQLFVDGERSLNNSISRALGWYDNKRILLDWYHLEKKCKELLSMGI